MQVQTNRTRSWKAVAKGEEWTKRNPVSVVREYTAAVTQYDLTQVGFSVFWRGAKISPAFSNKQKERPEDVREAISV